MLKLIVFLKHGDILKMVVFVILTKSLSSSLNELNFFKKKKERKIVFHPLEVAESSLILDYGRNLTSVCWKAFTVLC